MTADKIDKIIKLIEEEMVCGNSCPMYHNTDYDVKKCTCYKKDVIIDMKTLKDSN